MNGPYFVIAGEDEHWFLPVGMDADRVCDIFGFKTGIKYVLNRSLLICRLVTILSKLEVG